MRRYVVVGLGNFGSSAAESLTRQGHEVVAVDVAPAAVDRVAPSVTRAVVGDGSSVEVLRRAGAEEADAAIVSTGDDITASVLAVLALRDCQVEQIYVKVISRNHARVMDKLGVTETVFPEQESAQRLAHRLASIQIVNYVNLGPGFSAQEMAVPDRWVGRSLRELALPRRHRVAVIAVHDVLTDVYQAIPEPDAPLKESDTLLVAGEDDALRDLEKIGKRG
jgi:trk system potassium uptake protein TrkA